MKPTLLARLSVLAAVLWIGLGAVLFGVGGDDPSRVSLFGSVTIDGKPLEHGTICFFLISPSAKNVSGGGFIDHGNFVLSDSSDLVPGSYVVTIRELPDRTAQIAAGTGAEARPLPDRFNMKTELEVEIPHGGSRRLEFLLKR
jgi:hypothetical protein